MKKEAVQCSGFIGISRTQLDYVDIFTGFYIVIDSVTFFESYAFHKMLFILFTWKIGGTDNYYEGRNEIS